MRPIFLPVVLTATLAACGGGTPQAAIPVTLTDADRTFVERHVTADLRDPAGAAFGQIDGYALTDGSTVACGTVTARNFLGGTFGANPFYLRWRGGAVERYYRDDHTGYGFATIGCANVEGGRIATR